MKKFHPHIELQERQEIYLNKVFPLGSRFVRAVHQLLLGLRLAVAYLALSILRRHHLRSSFHKLHTQPIIPYIVTYVRFCSNDSLSRN